MSERVARDAARFPTAIDRSFRFKAGFFTKPSEQSIRFEPQQVSLIQLGRPLELAVEQSHLIEVER